MGTGFQTDVNGTVFEKVAVGWAYTANGPYLGVCFSATDVIALAMMRPL